MLGREIKQDGLVGKQRKSLKARLYKKLRQIPKPSITMQTVKCKMATTDTEKAETFNKFFTNVFTREVMNTMPWYPEKENVIPLTDIVISFEKIEEKLKKNKSQEIIWS